MQSDPFQVLGLPADADDETIRRRYLELVRENPPERAPERFAAIRQAYEDLKDLETRLMKRLFEPDPDASFEPLIDELIRSAPRPRLSLEQLVKLSNPR